MMAEDLVPIVVIGFILTVGLTLGIIDDIRRDSIRPLSVMEVLRRFMRE
jgi:hypothetical protein